MYQACGCAAESTCLVVEHRAVLGFSAASEERSAPFFLLGVGLSPINGHLDLQFEQVFFYAEGFADQAEPSSLLSSVLGF